MITIKELKEIISNRSDYDRVAIKWGSLRIESSFKYIGDMRETSNSKY